MENKIDVVIIGGGAAGFFTALQIKEKNPSLQIALLEKNNACLQKVKISGGGRCNVTNAQTNPEKLSEGYPRGQVFLKSAFHRFGSKETQAWFHRNGVPLKTEPDGRVFPTSDSSQTIIDLFYRLAQKGNCQILTNTRVLSFQKVQNLWRVETDTSTFLCSYLVVTSGSDKRMWETLENLGLPIVSPVPSLFTFQIQEKNLLDLQGVSFPNVVVEWTKEKINTKGGLLITHWGLSGPAVLRLSAWGAISWAREGYKGEIKVNWLLENTEKKVLDFFRTCAQESPKKQVYNTPFPGISVRFWKFLCSRAGISNFMNWAEFGKKQRQALCRELIASPFQVNGKGVFKEEFVTAGGIDLDAIDPTTFAWKSDANLFFAGEVLNIDAITGGYNFQAAWTGAWHVAQSITK